MSVISKNNSQTKKGVEPPTDVIKGGYQEVTPSPSPSPESEGTWGTAVPTSQPPSDKQNTNSKPSKPSEE
jgi:hypothetical protein